MAEHPNVEVWRKGHAAFSSRDMDSIRRYLAEDVTYHVPGSNPLSGDHVGLQAVLDFLAQGVVKTGGTLKVEPHEVMATDDHVVALVKISATRDGRQFSYNGVNVYHVKDGKLTEAWLFNFDPQVSAELFA